MSVLMKAMKGRRGESGERVGSFYCARERVSEFVLELGTGERGRERGDRA